MSPPTSSAASVGRRSQASRRDESERLLVEATLQVVADRGVSAATFEEIGRAAGYSRGLATQKFGSKQGLTEAVIAYLHSRREAILEADHVADMGPLDTLAHYVDSHLRDFTHERGGRAYFMLLAAAVADATSLREAFAASHERVRVWLRGVIQRGQALGEIRRDLDADAGALMIGSLLVGVSLQWLVNPTTSLDPIRVTILQTLENSFSPRPAPWRADQESS